MKKLYIASIHTQHRDCDGSHHYPVQELIMDFKELTTYLGLQVMCFAQSESMPQDALDSSDVHMYFNSPDMEGGRTRHVYVNEVDETLVKEYAELRASDKNRLAVLEAIDIYEPEY